MAIPMPGNRLKNSQFDEHNLIIGNLQISLMPWTGGGGWGLFSIIVTILG